ncbi:UDP-3-O-(3-hydroxymyristoyl)glucosamine N-acyltransferase [Kaarinaea lacus]
MFTLSELARAVNAELLGDGECRIDSVATLNNAKTGAISFLANPSFRSSLSSTAASAVIISDAERNNVVTNALIVDDPYVAYAKIATLLHPHTNTETGIHASAVVSPQAKIHASAWVGAMCVIEAGVEIGANTFIGPGCVVGDNSKIGCDGRLIANVTVCHETLIGDRVILHPGAVLGSDGFGLANDHGKWIKIPQVGRVVIGDDVEIGASTTIDRGAIEDTVIEEGVKIDNLVQVAHNVRIGAHTVLAGQVGIAGSATIGKHCALGGKVGVVGHLDITDNVTITGRSMVAQSITESGVYSSGMPVDTAIRWRKNVTRFRQLDDLARTVKRLEKALHNHKD